MNNVVRDPDAMPIPRLSLPPVVPDQKLKFETDELLRKLSAHNSLRYAGNIDKAHHQRQASFYAECLHGTASIAFVPHGINVDLVLRQNASTTLGGGCDFYTEPGKVHITAPLLMNGVCVKFRGWLDLQSLDGVGRLEFDEERASIEHKKLCEFAQRRPQREIIREFKEKQLAIAREWLGEDRISTSQDLWRPWCRS